MRGLISNVYQFHSDVFLCLSHDGLNHNITVPYSSKIEISKTILLIDINSAALNHYDSCSTPRTPVSTFGDRNHYIAA